VPTNAKPRCPTAAGVSGSTISGNGESMPGSEFNDPLAIFHLLAPAGVPVVS